MAQEPVKVKTRKKRRWGELSQREEIFLRELQEGLGKLGMVSMSPDALEVLEKERLDRAKLKEYLDKQAPR